MTFYHLSGSLLILQSKIPLIPSSRRFPQIFSADLPEEFLCYSEHLGEINKDGKRLVQGLVNMVDGVE